MNCAAPFPGPKGSRTWWEESKATPPAPGGRDPLWLVVVMAVGLAVGILVFAAAVAWWRGS